jgi:hypothetical protein
VKRKRCSTLNQSGNLGSSASLDTAVPGSALETSRGFELIFYFTQVVQNLSPQAQFWVSVAFFAHFAWQSIFRRDTIADKAMLEGGPIFIAFPQAW